MTRSAWLSVAVALLVAFAPDILVAQGPPGPSQGPQPYSVGNPLGMPMVPVPDGRFTAMSSNVKVYGAIYGAESCAYDPARGVIVVPNRGVTQNVQPNNAWVSFINHDGSVHTLKWIGVQNPVQRDNLMPRLVLNDPLGSDIVNGFLYIIDRDGGTAPNNPAVPVIRKFNMQTGAPAGEIRIDKATDLNDLAVAGDGTIYVTNSGAPNETNPAVWQIWKVAPNGTATVLVQGPPLRTPNGIALDPQGNVVVVNIGSLDVLTFSPTGKLIRTEQTLQLAGDGLVITADGTKYVSSPMMGGVTRIRPGRPAEFIAQNIPGAASMCYDSAAKQLAIPLLFGDGLAFVKLN